MLAAYGDVPMRGLLAIMAKGCPLWGKTALQAVRLNADLALDLRWNTRRRVTGS